MDPFTILLLAMSFLLVLWVTWAVGEPILFGTAAEEQKVSREYQSRKNRSDAEDLQEDFVSGKIAASEFDRISERDRGRKGEAAEVAAPLESGEE